MRFLLVAAAALAVVPQAEQFRQQVEVQLKVIQGELADVGYQRSHEYVYGELNSNAEETVSFELAEGSNYLAVAVCDQDCSDIDVYLLDENGNVVAQDEDAGAQGDFASAEVTPAWTGPFTLRVKMYACSAEPCHYGVAIFSD